MKATYFKPTTEEFLVSSEAIMITGSNGGQNIIDEGKSTSEENITQGDARRQRSVWDDEEMEEEEW